MNRGRKKEESNVIELSSKILQFKKVSKSRGFALSLLMDVWDLELVPIRFSISSLI